MKQIEHLGTVESFENGQVHVLIEQESACSGCHAKGYCNPAEKGREIVVKVNANDNLVVKKGDKVRLFISQTKGIWAVTFAYIIPVIICLLTLIIMLSLGVSEPLTALITIGILVIYFVFFLIFGHNFENKIDISIEKL